MERRGNRWIGRVPAMIVPLILLLGMLASSVAVRSEDAAPQFGIRPANPGTDPASSGYFVLKAQPGAMLQDAVVVANPGTVPVTMLLSTVDAATGQNGGAVYMTNNDPRKDVGAWITLAQSQVDVPPQKQVTVGFTVAVPKETRAGQHLGGIAAQYVPSASGATAAAGQGSGFGIKTVTRALTAVLLTVGDNAPAPSLKITGAQMAQVDGLPTLTLGIQNDGAALLKPKGTVTVTDAAGATVLSNQFALDTLVPQTAISYPIQADPPASPGTYKVHATLDFGGSTPALYDGAFVVTAQATATAPPAGRTRTGQPTAVAGAGTANGAANASGATGISSVPASGGMSPLVPILSGLAGALALAVVGMGVMVVRSRKRQQS